MSDLQVVDQLAKRNGFIQSHNQLPEMHTALPCARSEVEGVLLSIVAIPMGIVALHKDTRFEFVAEFGRVRPMQVLHHLVCLVVVGEVTIAISIIWPCPADNCKHKAFSFWVAEADSHVCNR